MDTCEKKLIAQLQTILEDQISATRQGEFGILDALSGRAQQIVDKLSDVRRSEESKFIIEYQHLNSLYKKLELMTAASKQVLSGQIRQIAKGKRTAKAYRGN